MHSTTGSRLQGHLTLHHLPSFAASNQQQVHATVQDSVGHSFLNSSVLD